MSLKVNAYFKVCILKAFQKIQKIILEKCYACCECKKGILRYKLYARQKGFKKSLKRFLTFFLFVLQVIYDVNEM